MHPCQVDDAVFGVADRVDDLGDACGAETFFAGVAGARHAESSVVADSCDPHCRAGCEFEAEASFCVDLRAGEWRWTVG